MHDFRERKNSFSDHIAMFSAAARNDDIDRLGSAFHSMEDDVFLQHAVLAEGSFAGFKNVKSAQLQALQEIFSKRTEVGTVAKASGRDAVTSCPPGTSRRWTRAMKPV